MLRQLLADHRTLGLILGVPTALLVLLYFVYLDVPTPPGGEALFPRIALSMLGILPMLVMFLVTSVSMQRERTSGTLERLWTTRLHRADLLVGYATAFAVVALAQAVVLAVVAYVFLGVQTQGSAALVLLIAALDAVVGVALGLMTSAFARTEFQAVQFMPAFVLPQFLLCGLLVARDQMPSVLSTISDWLPLSYAVDAMKEVTVNASPEVTKDFLVMVAWIIVSLVLGSLTLRRRTA